MDIATVRESHFGEGIRKAKKIVADYVNSRQDARFFRVFRRKFHEIVQIFAEKTVNHIRSLVPLLRNAGLSPYAKRVELGKIIIRLEVPMIIVLINIPVPEDWIFARGNEAMLEYHHAMTALAFPDNYGVYTDKDIYREISAIFEKYHGMIRGIPVGNLPLPSWKLTRDRRLLAREIVRHFPIILCGSGALKAAKIANTLPMIAVIDAGKLRGKPAGIIAKIAAIYRFRWKFRRSSRYFGGVMIMIFNRHGNHIATLHFVTDLCVGARQFPDRDDVFIGSYPTVCKYLILHYILTGRDTYLKFLRAFAGSLEYDRFISTGGGDCLGEATTDYEKYYRKNWGVSPWSYR